MRCYIDLINVNGTLVDEQGQTFRDASQAGQEALRVLAEIALDEHLEGDELSLAVEVRDDEGRVFYVGRLSLAGRWISVPS